MGYFQAYIVQEVFMLCLSLSAIGGRLHYYSAALPLLTCGMEIDHWRLAVKWI